MFDIDPELNYCPVCKDEYRADITTCVTCKAALVNGAEMRTRMAATEHRRMNRKGELRADEDLVAIQKGPLADMKRLEDLMEAENIGTMLVGDEKSCGKGCCPTVYTMLIRREDGQDALRIIEDEFRRTTGLTGQETGNGDAVFNPFSGEAECPACGTVFPTTSKTCPECGLCFGE